LAYKYLVLTSHYRKGLEFSLDSLKSSQIALSKLRGLLEGWENGGQINEAYKDEFIKIMSNDLSSSEVLALIWNLTKDKNIKDADKKATILEIDKVFGLDLGKKNDEEEVPKEIKDLVEERKKARNEKNWVESDRLRKIIEEKGYLIEDLQNDCKIRKVVLI